MIRYLLHITDANFTKMQASVENVFDTYELLERIILQLGSIQEMIRAQLVCRRWKDVIQDSPALQKACWYRAHREEESCTQQPPATWKLNPIFNSLGVSIRRRHLGPNELQESGDFDLTKRIYDTPGSWTTMLATQPPCGRIEVECFGDYSGDEIM